MRKKTSVRPPEPDYDIVRVQTGPHPFSVWLPRSPLRTLQYGGSLHGVRLHEEDDHAVEILDDNVLELTYTQHEGKQITIRVGDTLPAAAFLEQPHWDHWRADPNVERSVKVTRICSVTQKDLKVGSQYVVCTDYFSRPYVIPGDMSPSRAQ